jgi:hypothetical protein
MDTIYKSKKYEDNWYLQISVDADGYGTLEEVYEEGEVYEKGYKCSLWVNYNGFKGCEYDNRIHLSEVEFLKQIFTNVKQIQ